MATNPGRRKGVYRSLGAAEEESVMTRVPAASAFARSSCSVQPRPSAPAAAAIASPPVPSPPVVTALPASASGQRPVRRPPGQRVDQHAVQLVGPRPGECAQFVDFGLAEVHWLVTLRGRLSAFHRLSVDCHGCERLEDP